MKKTEVTLCDESDHEKPCRRLADGVCALCNKDLCEVHTEYRLGLYLLLLEAPREAVLPNNDYPVTLSTCELGIVASKRGFEMQDETRALCHDCGIKLRNKTRPWNHAPPPVSLIGTETLDNTVKTLRAIHTEEKIRG